MRVIEVLRCGLGEMKALALVKTVEKAMRVLSDEFGTSMSVVAVALKRGGNID